MRKKGTHSLLACLLWAMIIGPWACSDGEPLVVVRLDDPSSSGSGTFGLLTLVHDEESLATEGIPTLRVSGQFIQYQNISRDRAIRALDLEIASLPLEGVPGFCSVTKIAQRAEELASQARQKDLKDFQIDLLDAGNLLVESPEADLLISPKDFPSILLALGGVIYSDTEGIFTPEGEYTLSGAGGAEVGPFKVTIPAPRSVRIQDINGLSVFTKRVPVSLKGEMEIAWEEPDRDSDFLSIQVSDGKATISCLAKNDTGRFTIPSAFVEKLTSGKAKLVLQRVKVRPFSAPGAAEGEAVFIVQDWTTLTLTD